MSSHFFLCVTFFKELYNGRMFLVFRVLLQCYRIMSSMLLLPNVSYAIVVCISASMSLLCWMSLMTCKSLPRVIEWLMLNLAFVFICFTSACSLRDHTLVGTSCFQTLYTARHKWDKLQARESVWAQSSTPATNTSRLNKQCRQNKFRLIRINIARDMQAIISCSTNTLEFDKCSFNSAQSAVLGCFSACLCYNFKEDKCNRARLKCSVSITSNTGPTAISDQLSTAGDIGICGPALRASMR